MKERYQCYRRENGVYYALDTQSRKRQSLNTSDPANARRLLHALNEASQQPAINLQIARAYLQHADPEYSRRTWQFVMDEMAKLKTDRSRYRWDTAMKDKAFDCLRRLPLIKTQAEHFLEALNQGTVSTNVYLRRIHNFALDMDWILKSIIPKRQWPKVQYKEKRAITLEEHRKILAAEVNAERKAFYQLCWHLGGSQGDIARLVGEDVDWENSTVSFTRKKTKVPVIVRLGNEALNLLKDMPAEGPLFPYLAQVRAGDRATEFRSRCRQLGIEGVTLHSYRYAWAERALKCGYPERFAMENLGHNSKAVHRAYAKRATVKVPSLEEYERQAAVDNGERKADGHTRALGILDELEKRGIVGPRKGAEPREALISLNSGTPHSAPARRSSPLPAVPSAAIPDAPAQPPGDTESDIASPAENLVVYLCVNCQGKIKVDRNEFADRESVVIACPHCQNEIVLTNNATGF